MNRIEKITIGITLLALALSASLFGVWEDKTLLDAPLLVLIYLALAAWMVSSFRTGGTAAPLSAGAGGPPSVRRRQRSEVEGQRADASVRTSDFRPLISGSSIIPPGGMMLLLFWLLSAALIPFAVIPYEAKISTLRLGAYIGCYWVLTNSLTRFQQSRAVLMTVLSALILIALYSLVQHRVAPNLIFGMERYTDYWKAGRLGGTYQCPNHIAHLFQMWLPFCFVLLFVKRLPMFWRIACAYSLPLFALLIYQTQSRAGILGSVAGLSMTVLLLILYKSRRWFWIAAVAVPLLAAAALGGLWMGSAMFRERMVPVVKFVQHQFSGSDIEEEFQDFRPQTWADSMVMIADKPFFGHGPGNYDQVFPEYRKRVVWVRRITVHPHNEYVELLSEYGIVGGLIALLAVGSAVTVLLRLALRTPHLQHAFPAIALIGALAGTAVHGFFDFELRIFPNALMLTLLAGCAAGPLVTQRAEDRSQESGCRGQGTVRFVGLLFSILILVAAAVSLPVMTSAWLRAQGDRQVEHRQPRRAERFYRAAAVLDPQNWAAHLGLGQVYSQYRFFELDPETKYEWALRADEAYSAAYRRDSKKEEIVYGLGMAHIALGRTEEGLAYLRQAANYRRFNDFYWRKLGIELRKAGLYEEALAVFQHAAELDRHNPTVKRNIQWLKERIQE